MSLTITLARTAPDDVDAVAIAAVTGQTTGGDVDWAFLASQGFEAAKGDVRAVAGRNGRLLDRGRRTATTATAGDGQRCDDGQSEGRSENAHGEVPG